MEHDENDMEATCRHGNFYNQVECEECLSEEEIPNICEHDVDRDNEDCHLCDEWEERRDAAAVECDDDSDMEHGIEMDRLAEKHREQQDFAHFHD